MQIQITQQLANYTKSFLDSEDQSQDMKEFNWLNPIPKQLKDSQANKLLSDIPDEISQQILADSGSVKFFNDDIRAFRLYLQVLPIHQISIPDSDSQSKSGAKSNSINPAEFNQFFKENYISNQAYLLNPNQLKTYQDKIQAQGYQDWNQYMFEEVQKKQFQDQNKVQPNYSLKFFFTQLSTTQKLAFLSQNSTSTTQLNDNLNQLNLNSLPEIPTLPDNNLNQSTPGPNPIDNQFSDFSRALSKTNLSSSPTEVETKFQLNLNPSTPDILKAKDKFNKTQFQAISEDYPKQIKNYNLNATDQTNQLDTAPSFSQNSQNPDFQPQQSNYSPQLKIKPPAQSKSKSRQKQWNYAKIIGYSTAGVLTSGTSALAIFNSLFG